MLEAAVYILLSIMQCSGGFLFSNRYLTVTLSLNFKRSTGIILLTFYMISKFIGLKSRTVTGMSLTNGKYFN